MIFLLSKCLRHKDSSVISQFNYSYNQQIHIHQKIINNNNNPFESMVFFMTNKTSFTKIVPQVNNTELKYHFVN